MEYNEELWDGSELSKEAGIGQWLKNTMRGIRVRGKKTWRGTKKLPGKAWQGTKAIPGKLKNEYKDMSTGKKVLLGGSVAGSAAVGGAGIIGANSYYNSQIEHEKEKQNLLDDLRQTQNKPIVHQATSRKVDNGSGSNLVGTGIGAGVGGLAGYGIGSALSKDRAARILSALVGAGAGAYIGNQYGKKASVELSTSERIMCKIATRDGAGLGTLSTLVLMSKAAAGEQSAVPSVWDAIREWATADNYKNLKQVGTGLGVGLGTYALSGLIPGASKSRGARALLAGAAGIGAGMYGNKLVDTISGYLNQRRAAGTQGQQTQQTQQPQAQKQTPAKQAPAKQTPVKQTPAKQVQQQPGTGLPQLQFDPILQDYQQRLAPDIFGASGPSTVHV